MKPIAEHNAEMAAHMARWFPADPGKTPRAFVHDQARGCWLALSGPVAVRPGFLNYDGKIELVRKADDTIDVIKRRDMTDAEFSALPVAEPMEEAA